MLTLSDLKIYSKNKSSNSVSKGNDIVSFMEVSILLDLYVGSKKFTVIDIDDAYYYADKKISKKDIRKTVIDELKSSGYNYHIISRRKVAIHLEEGSMKRPKIWTDYNIVITYFTCVVITNMLCLAFGVLNNINKSLTSVVLYAVICFISLFIAYFNITNHRLQHKLYEIDRKIYNKTRGV